MKILLVAVDANISTNLAVHKLYIQIYAPY